MASPIPKPAGTRQRRNKSSTHTQLQMVHDVEAPPLPADREWHPLTLEYWRDIWASPMAPEYDSSDLHGLWVLAALVDEFWNHPTQPIAAEIRLQRQCFGLSPIDRRRLQWEIDRGDSAAAKTQRRREARAPQKVDDKHDPRRLLA
jgi:hypothetical protein